MNFCTFPLYPQNISKRMVNEFFEALIQRLCLHGIRLCFTFAKYENDTLSLCETANVFIDAFLLFQNPFSSVKTGHID